MKSWYLLYCKRGEQQRAKMHLENQSIECYYPEVEIEKMVRGKRKRVSEALFPSYIFIGLDTSIGPSFTTIRSTRGVMDFVRFGGQPHQVSESLITQLKECELGEQDCSQLPQPGQSIQIKSGQFSGFEAIYQEPDGEKRSILLITMINQQVTIKVDNTDVEWK
ncbi:transcription/translation regulatory transformer protein RfaH [Vibrio rumoiensis]|uniref:Transcription antitermination protein RfaH n=1 Tax=Vibrio rumoiensis 1S-45 TaxID=1188252 RepID=A0A1E5E0R0_9VIBR|nr:transcription/translation regulatory transformer protein RfaH [Vibrio rumoiensis]OEF24009.1 transcriptional activator RfaH [Vibrio rumoiensis 1S-45]